MRTLKRHGPRAAIALVVIGSALTIAAGGASSKPTAPSRNEAILAFKRCLRAHGVPMHHGSGINPSSPSFKSARACAKLLPGFAHAKAQMLKVSKCMRQHGISGFPNPTLSVPASANRARVVARGRRHSRDPVFDQPAVADVQACGSCVRIPPRRLVSSAERQSLRRD